jgi:hypothetical protein
MNTCPCTKCINKNSECELSCRAYEEYSYRLDLATEDNLRRRYKDEELHRRSKNGRDRTKVR